MQYNNGISKNKKFFRQYTKSTFKIQNKKWAEINDDTRRTYSTNIQIKLKTRMLKSSLCGQSNAYMLFKRTVTVVGAVTDNGDRNEPQIEMISRQYLKTVYHLLTA